MPVVVRKNGALNNAAAGAAQGVPQGFAMGQQYRRTQDAEQQQAFENEQVLRRAKLVDEQLQREAGERQAVGDAAGALAGGDPLQGTPPSPGAAGAAIGGAAGGGIGASIAAGAAHGAQDAQAIQRVRNIAKRLSKDDAIRFVQISHKQHLEELDKRAKEADKLERKTLTDKIANTIADGSLFPIQPDGTKTESPESTKSIQKLAEMAGNPKTDVGALKIQLANVKHEAANAEARFRRRQSVGTWVNGLADQVGADQPQTGVQDPAVVSGQLQQKVQLHKLAAWWTQFQDDIEAHPKGMEKFQEAVLDASNGLTYVNGKKVPFTMAKKEEELQAAKAQTEQMRQQLMQSQIGLNQARGRAVENPALHQGGGSGQNTDKPLTMNEAMQRATEIVSKQEGAKMSPELVYSVAQQLRMADQRARKLDEPTAPTGAPTPEATNAANAGQTSRAAAISPDAAVKAGWTTDEFDAYVDHGTMPKGKPIK